MFWKLLAAQATVVAILVIGAGLCVAFWLAPTLLHQRQSQLEATARRLAEAIRVDEVDKPALPEESRSEASWSTDPFMTRQWIPLKVESTESKETALHQLPEVRAALAGEPGSRMASDLDSTPSFLAVAVPVIRANQVHGAVRVTQSLEDLNRIGSSIKIGLIAFFLGGLLLAVVLANLLAGRWTRKLETMRDAVAQLPRPANEESGSVISKFSGEFAEFARTVARTRSQLSEQIHRVDQVRRDLQSMLETIPEAVLAVDADQRVLFANPSTYRLFDLPPHDISGQKLWEILRQPGLQDAVSLTFARREPTSTEFEIRYPPRVLNFHGRSLTVGAGRGIIIVLHDVTELRRLERMRQEFFASVSHELKTPLAAIKAYTETLLDDGSHEKAVVERFLHRIDEQADRLHTLVIDMLTLARVESADHGFDIKPIDVTRVVEASVDSFREKAAAKQLTLLFERSHESPTVLADAEGLGMIVRNLVDNALKYTPTEGCVTVQTVRDGSHLVIRVTDTGVGIPADDLTRIFERFYRVDKARSRELGGTGLGLSIVKHLAQRFGGTVSVRSRLQEGSTFTVTLPCSPNPAMDMDTNLQEQEIVA